MFIYKAFRYRIYPTLEQQARLSQWKNTLRFLWNLAHEQRLMGLARPRGERVYPNAFSQMRELTELRAELPWLADVPRNVCAQLLVELDTAWQRYFKKISRRPQWKRKERSTTTLCEPHPKVWRFNDNSTLRFPKLGDLRTIIHRPLEGMPKTCTITREVDQWFVSIICKIKLFDTPARTSPVVAIDRGINDLVADSSGHRIANPQNLKQARARLVRAQRCVARRRKGSNNQKKAKLRVAKLYRKVKRQRSHLLHNISYYYSKNHGTVIIEKLKINNMTRSAKGTTKAPGRNVCAKANLNRAILDASWGRLTWMLRYKLVWFGGVLIEVPPEYSSQTCSSCGSVDAASRCGPSFRCTACGFTENADVNAAKVLLSRGSHGIAACGGSDISRPMKQESRVVKYETGITRWPSSQRR